MRVEESNVNSKFLEKITLSHGNFYLFDKFVIGEINSGVTFNWSLAKEIIEVVIEYYGEDFDISYISNRVNEYSLNPIDWITFFNKDYTLHKIAFVSYTKLGSSNILLEKLFIKSRLKRFTSLESAVSWVLK